MRNYKDSNNKLHHLSESDIANNGVSYLPAGCVEISDEEAEAIRVAAILPPSADDTRAQRDSLLAACDWTQARDIPDIIALAWQPYRQALRDVTTQPNFPNEIIWPEKP